MEHWQGTQKGSFLGMAVLDAKESRVSWAAPLTCRLAYIKAWESCHILVLSRLRLLGSVSRRLTKSGPITSDAENPALPGDFKISWQSAAHEPWASCGLLSLIYRNLFCPGHRWGKTWHDCGGPSLHLACHQLHPSPLRYPN